MPRYFRTSNASRRYRVGELAVTFEPLENIGGAWTGTLAIEGDAMATRLAAAGIPQITEITAAEYEGLKKKLKPQPHSFRELTSPPPSNGFPVAEAVALVPSTAPSKPAASPALEPPKMATIKTAVVEPPDELKVAPGAQRRRR